MSGRAGPALAAFALAVGAAGCAYFNGMYNTNRYQALARSSEQAGRIAEARERWQQAALHAESLVARHPKSRWADAALLVRGRALLHLDYFSDAVPVLQQAAIQAREAGRREEALGLLGEAYLAISRPAEAKAVLDTAVGSDRASVRSEALLFRGRAWVALGRPDSAMVDFRASSAAAARYDLARAELLGGGRDTGAAAALYDSLAPTRPYVETEWRPALDSLAAAGALPHASALADRLARRRDLSSGMRARLLLDDANRRLAAGDSAAAAEGFAAAQAAAGDSAEGITAAVALSRLTLADAGDDSVLAAQETRLQSLSEQGGASGYAAQGLLRVLLLADAYAQAESAPDAYWFQRCELLRDSLHAAALAALDFGDMARRFPASPWAPKGLVAAIAAGHPKADSLRSLLRGRYARSPYTLAADGDTALAGAYAELEDSLRQTLVRRDTDRPARSGVRRGAAEDEPSIRRVRTPERPATPTGPPGAGPPRPEE